MTSQYSKYAKEIALLAKKAGEIIMPYHNNSIDIEQKNDGSPVTEADMAAHNYIITALNNISPDIPVVSEEQNQDLNEQIAKQKLYWIIDPIDGTKGFIKGSDEFTVNIALIYNNNPIGGVVYLPAQNINYFTDESNRACKQYLDNNIEHISTRQKPDEGIIVTTSKAHIHVNTEKYIEQIGQNITDVIAAHSSLKFCMVAEGVADLYPRFSPTMEWDTAAGHAIVNAASGAVITREGEDLKYGKDGLLNGQFFVKGN
ncbi:3'(2'),5'-bisphosphate nucleotidase CysQ [Rickettsiales bacterium]|nr:3'(2'),5'-bisphosphate nucleotidase CysQ [Rickettsiales bacterium]